MAQREPNLFEELIAMRDRQRAAVQDAPTVIKGRHLPVEINAMGRMRWYLHPVLTDTAIRALMLCAHELRPGEASGRLRFQGGSVIYFISGRGRTVLDGAVFEWKADDCLNVPLRPDGVILQHFNTGEETAFFVESSPNLVDSLGVDRGSRFEVLEDATCYPGSETDPDSSV